MAFSFAGQWGPHPVVDRFGNAVYSATFQVLTAADTEATVYTDRTKTTTTSQPLAVDGEGNAIFYAEPGRYTVKLTAGGSVTSFPVGVVPDADDVAPRDPTEWTEGNAAYMPAAVARGEGIDPTGVDDSTSALQALLTNNKDCFLPPGTYLVSSTLTIPAGYGRRLIGAGRGATTINYTGTGNAFTLDGPADGVGISNCTFADFSLVGTGSAQDGIFLQYVYHSEFERLEVSGFARHGISARLGFYISYRDVWSHDNDAAGLFLGEAANANNVYGGHYRMNLHGIHADGGAAPAQGNPHGNSAFGATFESNTSHDVYMQRTHELRLKGCYFEANSADTTLYCVYVSGVDTAGYHDIDGCNFSGSKRSIGVDASLGTTVVGNSINIGLWVTANAKGARLLPQARLIGTFEELGQGTLCLIDPTSTGRWYAKLANSTAKKWAVTAGGTATILDAGTNYIDIKAAGTTVARLGSGDENFRTVQGIEIDGNLRHQGANVGLNGKAPVAQGAAIADADGTLADLTTKFNNLLAYLRSRGDIAA